MTGAGKDTLVKGKRSCTVLFFSAYFIYYAVYCVFSSFIVLFLTEQGYSATVCGIITSLTFLANLLMEPVGGYITDTFLPTRRYLLVCIGIVSMVCAFCTKFMDQSWLLLPGLVLAAGLAYPFSQLMDYHADEWYKDPTLVHYNSQGTALKIAFWLLKEYDNYEAYDKALEGFEKLETIYGKAYIDVRAEAAKFAMTYKDDTVWNVMSSGAAWEVSYSDAFCFFQEMQTVHCVPIHSGEYFHGAFETCDKDLAILLFKSIGRTRPVDERAERFLNQFGGHHWVIDAEKLGLGELDESVAEYFNSLLFHPISKQFISAMADVRMHPMTYRRYMWKFDY